jgi:hypothetical protein
MPGLEIWEHAPMIKRMYDFKHMQEGKLGIQADRSIFPMTQRQEQRPLDAAGGGSNAAGRDR